MASTQRSIVTLAGRIGAAAAVVPSLAWKVPVGAGVGGLELRTTIGTSGAFNGGGVGAVIEVTNQAGADGEVAVGAVWSALPGGTFANVVGVQNGFSGDGNNQVDLSAYLFVRVRPTVDTTGGVPANIDVNVYGKFDYQRG